MVKLVSFAAVIRVVTQCFSPTKRRLRCVMTLITAVKETMVKPARKNQVQSQSIFLVPSHMHDQIFGHFGEHLGTDGIRLHIEEMLYIRMHKPTMNVQMDSIHAKAFV